MFTFTFETVLTFFLFLTFLTFFTFLPFFTFLNLFHFYLPFLPFYLFTLYALPFTFCLLTLLPLYLSTFFTFFLLSFLPPPSIRTWHPDLLSSMEHLPAIENMAPAIAVTCTAPASLFEPASVPITESVKAAPAPDSEFMENDHSVFLPSARSSFWNLGFHSRTLHSNRVSSWLGSAETENRKVVLLFAGHATSVTVPASQVKNKTTPLHTTPGQTLNTRKCRGRARQPPGAQHQLW